MCHDIALIINAVSALLIALAALVAAVGGVLAIYRRETRKEAEGRVNGSNGRHDSMPITKPGGGNDAPPSSNNGMQ